MILKRMLQPIVLKNMNSAQPELKRNIFKLTWNQLLEAQLDQEDGGIDHIKENVATKSAEKYESSSARAEEKYPHAHQGLVVGGPAGP